ncbi:hypothetical protein AC249_AIPGENE26308 [Exaiptasia diaphana]|nr:hypothetical protein AC249_AIPGENE26308 [Exaiptasia diaphana]
MYLVGSKRAPLPSPLPSLSPLNTYECKGKDMAEKNPLAASAWQSLTKEQKDEYKKKSKNMKEMAGWQGYR